MKKKFLSARLALASVCLFAFISIKAENDKNDKQSDLINKADKAKTAMVFANRDTIPIYKISGKTGLTGTAHTSIDGKEYYMVIKNGVVTDMSIDGKKIPSEKIVDHKPVLDNFYNKMKANEEQGIRDREQAMKDNEQAVKDNEQVVKDSERVKIDSERAERARERAKIDREQAKIARERAEIAREQAKIAREQAEIAREQAERDREQAEIDREQGKIDREQAERDMEGLINELITENIIKEKKEFYSLQLNVTELIVNGIKQPVAIHKRFKDKYVKSETVTLWYERR
jgi:colicin import membrane protein